MTSLRYSLRHIRASIEFCVEETLGAAGWWTTPPAGLAKAEFFARPPVEGDLKPVAGNVVFVSHGFQAPVVPKELGGGLVEEEHVFFVDVRGENRSAMEMMASDILDRLRGDMAVGPYLTVRERGNGPIVPGWQGEFEDVFFEEPNPSLPTWGSVKASLMVRRPGGSW